MYSKEPLSDANAHKRDRQYETACFSALTQAVDVRWEYLVEPAVRYHKTAAYDIPNQYVRIQRRIHLTGEELLEMDAPPRTSYYHGCTTKNMRTTPISPPMLS